VGTGMDKHRTSAELPRTSRRTTFSRSLTPLQCVTGAAAASCFSSAAAGDDAEADMSVPAPARDREARRARRNGTGAWSWSWRGGVREREKRRLEREAGRWGGFNWGISGTAPPPSLRFFLCVASRGPKNKSINLLMPSFL
jgi:hypothetical protein